MTETGRILIRGGGDLASGVAAVLFRNGWQVLIAELSEPKVVRRKVAFAEAVWEGWQQVEEIIAVLAKEDVEIENVLQAGRIAVIVDPQAEVVNRFNFAAIVDARMLKHFSPDAISAQIPLIGLGPGFVVGKNCLAVVETNRGENLGEIIWEGSAEQDTGVPAVVEGRGLERVLYSPREGIVRSFVQIGDFVKQGEVVAEVDGTTVVAPFDGLVRGLLRDGLKVGAQVKLGDIDPRMEPSLATRISDKALVIGKSVLDIVENLQ
ncbi:MAG: selenium-dependent molybdenum cofactor biosynthesis protein YqeB [Anaerolineaceae bacterium]|nr:selenium-dependent molybdenum cofactor biosynthesis protein YqeB [Anaerolineaceae bacterium]MDD4042157.1 selenium-dependent molybdenum cofactor biosynthesis protein YqeB [Anaerolineaceae bacterium]MDD4576993.1 selenium-dependent molybdenum cofactor biosynthesis protein YqeB [Anaerolineaceae bacterium]